MNGAERLFRTLVAGGVEVCFMNPGTSEMQFVATADRVSGLRCVLGLFEGVVSGAADGYARMTGAPAATLFHLGPGLGNALANLHNAKHAHVPMVNIVGDHATYFKKYNVVTDSNIYDFARPVSEWIRRIDKPRDIPQATIAVINAALVHPGQIATLIVPADCSWGESGCPETVALDLVEKSKVNDAVIEDAAKMLRNGRPTVILLAGEALTGAAAENAGKIADACNARLYCERFHTRLERGRGRVNIERIPYPNEMVMDILADTKQLILVGSRQPVGYFAYPGYPPDKLVPADCIVLELATLQHDMADALERLSERLEVNDNEPTVISGNKPQLPKGDLNPETIAKAIAALLPEQAIISEEAMTSEVPLLPITANSAPHDLLVTTGGAIGQGMAVSIGAAIACPDRKVLNLQADGAGMYTLQSLWTQAREELDVTTIIYSNRLYKCLYVECERVGAGEPGRVARDMLTLDAPEIDWVKLAEGMGVSARRVTSLDEFNKTLGDYISEPGPSLIEAVV